MQSIQIDGYGTFYEYAYFVESNLSPGKRIEIYDKDNNIIFMGFTVLVIDVINESLNEYEEVWEALAEL